MVEWLFGFDGGFCCARHAVYVRSMGMIDFRLTSVVIAEPMRSHGLAVRDDTTPCPSSGYTSSNGMRYGLQHGLLVAYLTIQQLYYVLQTEQPGKWFVE